MAKIVCMGEIMLRLSTPDNLRIMQATSFDINYGGGEANVAVSLANFGHEVDYVSAIVANPIGDACIASLRKMNVGVENIARVGDRLGIYFLETGSAMRPSNVIYDRANSSISKAKPEDFDFDKIFEGADWFHFTGITPAISDSAIILIEEALKAAKSKGIKISVDLNFRKKLWTSEKAISVMSKLCRYVDVCIGNEEDASKVLGFTPKNTDVNKGELELGSYTDIFKQMIDEFNFEYVISSLRKSNSASDNDWSGIIMDRKTRTAYHSTTYKINPIVDRVGGGDAFAAGIISELANGKDYKEALEFAVAASALKHTIVGDVNMVSRKAVENLVAGDSSGRVSR